MEALCPLCRKKEGLILRDERLNMYKCGPCDHAFSLIDKTKRTQYADDYYTSSHANWFRHPNYELFESIHSYIRRLVKKEKIKLLDIGCGKGDLLKFMRNADPAIGLYGIDVCDNYLPEDIKFTKMDFLKGEYETKVDVICSIAVIEHMEDPAIFLEKVHKILLPDGIVFITTENTGGVFYAAARVLKTLGFSAPFYSLYEPAHLNHFTNHSLTVLLERYGFDIISIENHNYPVEAVNMPPANDLTKAVYRMGVRVLFGLPKRYGILQTAICRKSPKFTTGA